MCTCNDSEGAVIATSIVYCVVMTADDHCRRPSTCCTASTTCIALGTGRTAPSANSSSLGTGSTGLSACTVRAAVYVPDRIDPRCQSCFFHPLPYLHMSSTRHASDLYPTQMQRAQTSLPFKFMPGLLRSAQVNNIVTSTTWARNIFIAAHKRV